MDSIQIPPVDLRLLTPLLIVVSWASLLLLIDVFVIPEGRKKLTGYLAIAGLAVAGLAGIPLWNVSGSTFAGMLVLDRYSLSLTWIFLIAGALSIAIALDYLPRHAIEQGEYYPLIMFAVAGMILMAQGTDLIVLFLGIEALSITLYILTGFAYPRLTSEEAAMKYLVLGAFAAGFFVYGIALISGATGTTSLAGIAAYLGRQPFAPQTETLFLAGASLVLIGFSFKVALVPFHMWTPDVYEGSPTPVAAFMSVGTKGAALAALLRFVAFADDARPFWLPVLATLAVATMVIGNLGALGQSNVKRMLAYSSIGHAGYILLAIMVAVEGGAEAFLFYMLAYTLTNLGAFGVLIALEQRGEAAWSIDDFGGLYQRRPLLAVAMALFMFSLAGVPPTAGFMAKFFVFTAAYAGGLGWLALIGVLTSAIAAYYYLRVVVKMFMQEPARELRPELSQGLNLELVIAGVATLILGLLPAPFVLLVERSLSALGGG